MYSKPPNNKSSRGMVKVEADKGSLRLALPCAISQAIYGVKQKYITVGMKDTPFHRKLAETKVSLIQSDIDSERFDITLEKYELGTVKYKNLVAFPIADAKPSVTLQELWARYVETKRDRCAPGTWKSGYLVMSSHLDKCPYSLLDESQKIFDWAAGNLTPDTAKRLMIQLSAACKWGIKSKLITLNPFDGLASEIKIKKVNYKDNDIKPFTKEERDAIINSFASNRYYKHYTNYVKFLFFTGCRPSEAIALQWKHIQNGFITFEQAVVAGKGGLVLKSGLKTQSSRKFPINAELLEIIDAIKTGFSSCDAEALVFPSPDGKWIDIHNFRNRAWKSVLSSLDIEYRKPYQTRHTFITMAIDAGVKIPRLAKLVGNSAKIVLEHYAGTGSDTTIPSLR